MMRLSLLILLLPLMLSACDVPEKGDGLSYPDAKGADFQVYARHCSECHAPAQPSAHSASEWPGVIARMEAHRVQRSLGPIPAADMMVIRRYLEGHAGKGNQ